MREMGLEIYITELDVDDTNLPGPDLDHQIVQTYAQYLEIVGPFARMICFEELADKGNINDEQIQQVRADGQSHRPNLFDNQYARKPEYSAVLETIRSLPRI